MVEIHPASAARQADVAEVFAANGTMAGCGCMYFLLTNKEFGAGWHTGGNRQRLHDLIETTDPPMGLLAYRDGVPVGWCAAGPRSRYARAMRSPLYRSRDQSEDDSVWLLPCLFVRREARRRGVAAALLAAAVDLAAAHGAPAVEAFPFSGGERRNAGDVYIGTEAMFAALGFQVMERPSAKRVIMRRDLAAPSGDVSPRPTSARGRGARRDR